MTPRRLAPGGESARVRTFIRAELADGNALIDAQADRGGGLDQVAAGEIGVLGKYAVARIDLTGTHAAFARLGFTRRRGTAHPGYDRVTSWIYRIPVNPPGRG